mmetsp:Transcript_14088/g.15263  ORF Transcript_14088/g.15263 Transcript_14088/m.15263 type:complete len:137 (-) Transcript_14088:1097-1507(-)|eukprot:gene887-940_t
MDLSEIHDGEENEEVDGHEDESEAMEEEVSDNENEENFVEESDEELEEIIPRNDSPVKASIQDVVVTSEEIEKLTKELIEAKVELSFLKKRKKLLLEEVHRQCLEGELDPKKRLKPYYDKRKKLKVSQDIIPLEKA